MSLWEQLKSTWQRVAGEEPAPRGSLQDVLAVQGVLERIAPLVRADGGEIVLVAVEDGWVEVRLRGACASCSASSDTLEGVLRPALAQGLPGFRGLRRSP